MSRLTSNRSVVTYVLNSDTSGRARSPFWAPWLVGIGRAVADLSTGDSSVVWATQVG